jgi:hypothetical protein
MKASVSLWRIVMFAGAALLAGAAQPAAAVEMSVYVTDPYQVMTGSSVRAGHTVIASTGYNRLVAGGEFEVVCNHPTMSLSAPGRRTESGGSGLLGGVRLTVTIPYEQPAYVNMAGFHALPRGAIVECQYNWNAQALEGHYTIGAGGIGMVVGQGEKRDGGYRPFRMQKPGTATGDDDACIP